MLIWSVTDDYKLLQKFVPLSDSISSVSWSPDDKQLLATSEVDVTLCRIQTGTMLTLREHNYTVATAAWLPDGSGFVTGGMDGKIVYWDADGYVLHKKTTSPFRVLAVAASPDGAHLIALSQRQVAPSTIPTSVGRGHVGVSTTALSASTASDHSATARRPHRRTRPRRRGWATIRTPTWAAARGRWARRRTASTLSTCAHATS